MDISKLVIIGLILIWTVVLLPDVIQRINRGRRGDTIRSFNSQLTSLGRNQASREEADVIDLRARSGAALDAPTATAAVGSPSVDNRTPLRPVEAPDAVRTPAPAPVPRVPDPPRPVSPAVRKRRQDVLMSLGSAAVLTLLATVAFGGIFLYLHLLTDVLLAAYLVLLARAGATTAPAPRHTHREPDLAPVNQLDRLGTGTVGSPRPLATRRVAN